MSTGSEYGEFEKYRGISVKTIFEHQAHGTQPKYRFTPRLQERFIALEQTHMSADGEPVFLYELAKATAEGKSLRRIGSQFGLSHKQIGNLLQAAAIPYATREEAVQRLWNDPEFREKNSIAMLTGRDRAWKDPQARQVAIGKLRESALKQWEDPAFRDLVAAASSETSKQRWQDPEYRARMLGVIAENFAILRRDPNWRTRLSERRRQQWQDADFYARNADISRSNLAATRERPSYRKKRSEGQKRLWEDPEYRRRMAKAKDERMADPERRARISETRRQIALANWENPEYRAKMTEAHKALWQDPDYRKHITDALHQFRSDPANRDRFVLPTLHGFRSDIGFYAQSAWEANVARVFQLIGREYVVGVNLSLAVTDDFQELFQDSGTTFNIDFSTIDGRGRTVMYELMAHPLEDPESWAKIEMARRQHPELVIRVIDEEFYNRLRRRFEVGINNNPQLHGWEKTGFNLKTNPEVFG